MFQIVDVIIDIELTELARFLLINIYALNKDDPIFAISNYCFAILGNIVAGIPVVCAPGHQYLD